MVLSSTFILFLFYFLSAFTHLISVNTKYFIVLKEMFLLTSLFQPIQLCTSLNIYSLGPFQKIKFCNSIKSYSIQMNLEFS